MNHHDRTKNARGQAVTVLLATSVLTFASAGLGFWIGHQETVLNSLGRAIPNGDALANAQSVNTLAVRLGAMQAELLRLNALGERLVRMSGLNPEEFDFVNPPPQGGPEQGPVRDYTIKELATELSSMVNLIQDRQRKLDMLDDVIPQTELLTQSAPTSWPVHFGYISSPFGFRVHPIRKARMMHEGVDFASARGAPIKAVADGVVIYSGRRNGYGNVIDVQHGNGLVTRYAHNTTNLVDNGQRVRRGQQIATVGATGTATGPHVHFEVRVDDHPVDPMPYLNDPARLTSDTRIARYPG